MHRGKEKGCQLCSQRIKAETSISSTMCKRALVFNRTDYLCNIHAYYMHTNIHRKRKRERESKRGMRRGERERERAREG